MYSYVHHSLWECKIANDLVVADAFIQCAGTCEDFEHLHFLRGTSDTATALLIECRGDNAESLQVGLYFAFFFRTFSPGNVYCSPTNCKSH